MNMAKEYTLNQKTILPSIVKSLRYYDDRSRGWNIGYEEKSNSKQLSHETVILNFQLEVNTYVRYMSLSARSEPLIYLHLSRKKINFERFFYATTAFNSVHSLLCRIRKVGCLQACKKTVYNHSDTLFRLVCIVLDNCPNWNILTFN